MPAWTCSKRNSSHTIAPLLELGNVVLTPHIGSATIRTRSKMSEMVTKNVILVLQRKRPMYIYNSEVFEQP